MGGGGRGSQVWQTQDLRERIFGSVAMIGVTGDFSEVWQIQELATFWGNAEVREGGVRSAARRERRKGMILEGGALRRSGRSEPSGERASEPRLGWVSHPSHISVRPNQHGGGSRNRPDYRKLPRTKVFGVGQLDPIYPWSDVEAAGLTEVEEYRPGIMQQAEEPQRAAGGDQVEIGHAAPEQ